MTVLASGGSNAADAEGWDATALARLDVPVLQGLCVTSSRAEWAASDAGLAPIDAAMQVAIPEFDGRLITVPFSFKETGEDGVPTYVADPERAARVAGLAVRHARLRSVPNADKRVALVLSSYPTKHARVGNAVGLDTPASAVLLLQAMRAAGYDVGDPPSDGDLLIHTLIAAGGHDVEWLTEDQLSAAVARVPLADYRQWFSTLPDSLQEAMVEHWGAPPGSLYVDGGDIVLAALRYGNVVLAIQPPRGFGENPIAIYHDPDLPPSHHYLAAYRWLSQDFGADAVVHLGKHGTLEWLPGRGLGLGADDAPDAVLGDLPLFYPFIVNDPGEGTQAKRRAHATVVDHLVPPMARAETYDEMAQLEQLLDEYAQVQAMDPAKLPTIRAQIWELVTAAQLHHDLHVSETPSDDEFDDFLLHVDGYLCEVKDVLIRDGLHVLGQAPAGEPRVDLVLGILRAQQTWGGTAGSLPGLRRALGLPEDADRVATDRVEQEARALVSGARRRRLVRPLPSTGCDDRDDVRERCCASPARRWCRGWRAPPTSWTTCCTGCPAASCRRVRPGRRRAGWSACCRPAATSTPSTPRRSRRRTPGPPASRSPTRCCRATSPTTASTPRPSASSCGGPARCAPPATTSPRRCGCSACGRCGTGRRAASPGWRSCRARSSAVRAST